MNVMNSDVLHCSGRVFRMQQRSRDIWGLIEPGHHKFDGLDDFQRQAAIQPGLNSIMTNNRWLDFFYEDRGAAVTMVTFNAALPASVTTYPVFSARPVASELGINYLGFADSAQGSAESLPTFWHLSTKRVDALKLVPSVINKLTSERPGQNLLFFGSSAGGFGALYYSAMFPGSAAVVLNPRINVMHEPKRFPKYAPVAYPGIDRTQVAHTLPYDLAKHYEQPQGNYVVYLQNLQDTNYYRHHYLHFRKAVAGRNDVRFVTGEWGQGHVVPPRDVYVKEVQSLAEAAPHWGIAHPVT